jgi:hypothetical protein
VVAGRCLLLGGFCCKTLRASIAGLRFSSGGSAVALPVVGAALPIDYQRLTRRLRKASLCKRWRGTAEKPGEPPHRVLQQNRGNTGSHGQTVKMTPLTQNGSQRAAKERMEARESANLSTKDWQYTLRHNQKRSEIARSLFRRHE